MHAATIALPKRLHEDHSPTPTTRHRTTMLDPWPLANGQFPVSDRKDWKYTSKFPGYGNYCLHDL
jgi:hypothetical protein